MKERKEQKIVTILLIVVFFYLSFMILDRVLSLLYGFNFQPYGQYMPKGFTWWGHVFNGSAAALGMFLTFSLYNYGKRRKNAFLSILAILIALTICSIIPYKNDAVHLAKNDMAHTLPGYLIFNVFYVLFCGLLMYEFARTVKLKLIAICIAAVLFLIIHFLLYAPAFPEFYWS